MKIENLCICYANNYHLGIILGEYLKKNPKVKSSIKTFFEEGIKNEISTLIENYKMEQLLNINFENTIIKTNSIDDIKKEINNNDVIIIKGNIDYINRIKEILNKITSLKEGSIKVITCINYEYINQKILNDSVQIFTK